jgi:hypothetical protein
MAGIASLRKIQGLVIGIRCRLKLRQMACGTIRKDAILPSDKRFVTGLAFHRGVGANQREEILMIADLLTGSEPALHDMALGAIRAKLTQMNVGMTIGAILADVGEDRVRMTLRARNSFVHAAERISSLIVIEFGDGANRSPTGSRMAILARNCQRAMRVRGRTPLRS